jgi:hypothetical protein
MIQHNLLTSINLGIIALRFVIEAPGNSTSNQGQMFRFDIVTLKKMNGCWLRGGDDLHVDKNICCNILKVLPLLSDAHRRFKFQTASHVANPGGPQWLPKPTRVANYNGGGAAKQ